MSRRAFAGMTPAPDAHHARWVVDDLLRGTGLAATVPTGFAACARLMHRLPGGARWADVAPAFLGPGDGPVRSAVAAGVPDVEGSLDAGGLDALLAVLAPVTPPGPCHFGLWEGWGWLRPASSDVYVDGDDRATGRLRRAWQATMQPLWDLVAACPRTVDVGGGRPMLLFDGPLDAAAGVGSEMAGEFALQSPQWWWPSDRSWFVATEIDFSWTYVAGPESLVDAVVADPGTEAVRLAPTARW